MTEEQVTEKTDKIINDLAMYYRDKVQCALNCGALNLEQYEDNYILPKIIITATLENNASVYMSPYMDNKARKEINNLKKFI